MAMIKCQECGKDISDQAPTCPGCGAPKHIAQGLPEAWLAEPPSPAPPVPRANAIPQTTTQTPQKQTSGCAAVLIIVLLITVGAAISRCSAPDENSSAAIQTQNPTSATTPVEGKPAADLLTQLQYGHLNAANRLGIAQALIRNYPETSEAREAAAILPTLQRQQSLNAPDAVPEIQSQWRYGSFQDDMSSKPVLVASVISTNSFEFDFPYQGIQHATLKLRKHPRWGSDVMLSIEKGQILCSTYDCPVRVRFDDGPAQTLSGTEPGDNSSETVFIPGYAKFSKQLQQAKRVRIEVNIFQQGTLVADFTVIGFNSAKFNFVH